MPIERSDSSPEPVEVLPGRSEEDAADSEEETFDSGASPSQHGEADEDADAPWQTMDADTPTDAHAMDGAGEPSGRDGFLSMLADGATDGDAPVSDAGQCLRAGIDAWRAAHLKSDLRDRITSCRIDCDNDVTCADACLRRSAGIDDCKPCTRAELECSARFCNYACLPSKNDQACLACLCQADCFQAFEGCAGQQLDLCTSELFTFGSAPSGPPLGTAALLMGKSTTGALSLASVDPTTQLLSAELRAINQFPSGLTRLAPISLPGFEMVLQYGENCNAAPCTVRAYPVLGDGSFGKPVFQERWDAGYVDLESFAFLGQRYLVRLRGGTPTVGPNVLVDRFSWSSAMQSLERETVAQATVRPSSLAQYTVVEPFFLGDAAFMLFLAPESGEAEIRRMQDGATGAELVVAADPMTWSRGWGLVEGINSLARFYIFAMKSGRVAGDQEPVGHVRIWQPRLNEQGHVQFDAPVLDEQWGEGMTHVLSFTDVAGLAHVVLYQEAEGNLGLHRLGADPARWHDDFLVPQQIQSRGRVPPWDVLGLVRDGKW